MNFEQQLNDFNMDMDFDLNIVDMQMPDHQLSNRATPPPGTPVPRSASRTKVSIRILTPSTIGKD